MMAGPDYRWGESAAADRVRSLVCGLRSDLAHRTYFMIFQAYIDDSAKDDAFVLGGHIASTETWERFSREWQELLPLCPQDNEGIRKFKMQDMPISEDGICKIKSFYKLTEKYPIVSVSSFLKRSDLLKAQSEIYIPGLSMAVPKRISDWGGHKNVFIMLMKIITTMVHSFRSNMSEIVPLDAIIEYVFDETREEKRVRDGWDRYNETWFGPDVKGFGPKPRFESDDRFMPLQAADLWAWWIRELMSPSTYFNEEQRQIRDEFIQNIRSSSRKQFIGHMDLASAKGTMLDIVRNTYNEGTKYNTTYVF